MLGAPTSLASIMVIGLHHAAVKHVGGSSEVGQREHMVRQGLTGKCWSEFLCLGDYISPRRAKWGGGGTPPPTTAAGAPPAGPWKEPIGAPPCAMPGVIWITPG
jgi:hypothetical protein